MGAFPVRVIHQDSGEPPSPEACRELARSAGIDAVQAGTELPLPAEDVIVPVELVVRESSAAPRDA